MQRAAYDMLGIEAQGSDDRRPWLRHAAWPADKFPLRAEFDATHQYEFGADDYPFVSVAGDGVILLCAPKLQPIYAVKAGKSGTPPPQPPLLALVDARVCCTLRRDLAGHLSDHGDRYL